MLRKRYFSACATVIRQLSQAQGELAQRSLAVVGAGSPPEKDEVLDVKVERKSVLEECTEDISHVAPYLKPSFNLAAYANKSETLRRLVELGVDLYKLEKKWDVSEFILKSDFERDLKQHVIFLSDLGVPVEELGAVITKNPLILQEDLDNLVVRINYLKSKKFTDDMITAIVTRNPSWLSFSTQDIDSRLGYFQSNFSLSGNEVRQLAVQQPKLITYSLNHVKTNIFMLKEEMGFSPEETKSIIIKKPNIFMKDQKKMLQTFEFVHKRMKIPLERIVELPQVLLCRESRIKQRYLFLEKLGKDQFNPRKPNYVSLIALVSGSDAQFCESVAKSSIQAFNTLLKSL